MDANKNPSINLLSTSPPLSLFYRRLPSPLAKPPPHPTSLGDPSCGDHPTPLQGCMDEPEWNFGFEYDNNGRVNILRSQFFDVGFDFDDTVEEYLDRILPTLVDSIDEHFSIYTWIIKAVRSLRDLLPLLILAAHLPNSSSGNF
ncbi:hypothetical protein KFK09_025769 [Dendrobium nobile]|uniref:Uncharacterized protein n=1 Tax=Dendrobium nobile TaxID=94219 RepID=A0A8T3A629_DENNO|nr:hypothetical protein KFK09_025769 [Dendrobium nobile]